MQPPLAHLHRDRAVYIGAQNSDVARIEPLEHRRIGVTKPVRADRHDRDLRLDRVEQQRARRCARAMVAHLEHGERLREARGEHLLAEPLARHLGSKEAQPCAPATAERHTGYKVGGISPFGTRRALPVYVEASILELPRIWINGGRRGLLVVIDPQVLVDVLGAQPVSVAREG